MGGGWMSMATQGISMLAGTALSYWLSPKSPGTDSTNYSLLMQTQRQADLEAEEAKAAREEAKKREELRMQQMYGRDIHTSEVGADTDKVGVRNQVLGSKDDADEV